MVVIDIEKLRELRKRATALSDNLAGDLRPFLHKDNKVTFRSRPDTPSQPDEISVATTCTCLMALAIGDKLTNFYEGDTTVQVGKCIDLVARAKWRSSGLPRENIFTTSIVTRCIGFLIQYGSLPIDYTTRALHDIRKDRLNSITQIAQRIARKVPKSFTVQAGSPPNTTVAYWFVDGVHRSGIELDDASWSNIVKWGSSEFRQQYEYVAVGDAIRMDPVAMAMAACLVARLRRIMNELDINGSGPVAATLPSDDMLEKAILMLFANQTEAGTWHKYFELFSLEDKHGSNFCFTFEMLEAFLHEFAYFESRWLLTSEVLNGVEKALTWCEKYRLRYRDRLGQEYNGWNSGAHPAVLVEHIPGSWATGCVHMYLSTLIESTSIIIGKAILEQYDVEEGKHTEDIWNETIDVQVILQAENRTTSVKELLHEEIGSLIEGISSFALRRHAMKHRRSVFLFGPPGTSKTRLVKAFAHKIGWPLLKIKPGLFLDSYQRNVFTKSGEIFQDLMDLTGVVVFFDEIDAFVSDRRTDTMELAREFLITDMLPKLVELHDAGRVIFFAATNHWRKIDRAIKRSGRFDLLVCMQPPKWAEKLANLHMFLDNRLSPGEVSTIRNRLEFLVLFANSQQRLLLDLLTFDEMRLFLQTFEAGGTNIASQLGTTTDRDFLDRLQAFVMHITLSPENPDSWYHEFEVDKGKSLRQ